MMEYAAVVVILLIVFIVPRMVVTLRAADAADRGDHGKTD